MKYKILPPVIYLCSMLTVYGQDFKVSKENENTRNGKAIYYIIKDRPDVKHGKYIIKAWSGNDILLEGEYNEGKKTGKWTEKYYGRQYDGALKSTGVYRDDIKIGEWTYYNHKGEKVQVYDHSKNELIYSKMTGKSQYVGGSSALSYDLNQLVPIPKELNTPGTNRFSIDTEVIIKLNSENRVAEVTFTNPIGYGIEDEIRDWLKDESKAWVATGDGLIVVPLKMNMQF
jgi:hypothetical protein